MSTSAALIVLAIALLLAVLIVIDQLSRRTPRAADPSCTLERAWRHYLSHPKRWGENHRRAIAAIADREAALAEIEPELRQTLEAVLDGPTPLPSLRLAIMDASERFVLFETMAESSGSQLSAAPDGLFEAGTLRAFGELRFGDFGSDDWYTHYLTIARANARNVAAMVRKTVRGEMGAFEVGLHEPLARAMREAREVLLRLAPRTPVDRATEVDLQLSIRRPEPSQAQIDELTAIFAEHFERLFVGQVYRTTDGRPIPPAAAVRLDAALLFTQLAATYRMPVDAWGRILDHALGGHMDGLEDDKELLMIAQEARRAWLDNESGSPLRAALETACRLALGSEIQRDAGALRRMLDAVTRDAGDLVGSVQSALRRVA